GLGRLNAQIAVVRQNSDDGFEVIRLGDTFKEWLGTTANNQPIGELQPDCGIALTGVIDAALRQRAPARSVAHKVVEGAVLTFDVMALPLASRWGRPMFLVFVREHESRYSLVDTIFDAT